MEVTKDDKESAPPKHLPLPTRDDYLDLQISKLCHRNAAFQRRRDVFLLAVRISDSLAPSRLGHLTLRRARNMAL